MSPTVSPSLWFEQRDQFLDEVVYRLPGLHQHHHPVRGRFDVRDQLLQRVNTMIVFPAALPLMNSSTTEVVRL